MIEPEAAGDESNPTAYDRFQRSAEIPMLIFAVLTIPATLVPLVMDLDGAWESGATALDAVIWVAFVVEYVTLLVLAPNKWEMVRTHWFDLVLVLLPLLRPLRAFRLLRLLRVVAGSGRAVQAVRRLDNRPGFRGFFGLAAVIVILGGYLVYIAERTHPESNIDSAGEGVWWAIVTSTTVGYGDFYPITVEGRAVAGILMFVGIAILSVVTASIAAYFVENDEDANVARLEQKLDSLHERFDWLEAALANGADGANGASSPDAVAVDDPHV